MGIKVFVHSTATLKVARGVHMKSLSQLRPGGCLTGKTGSPTVKGVSM